jgi:predicted DNA-binding protein (UPF0251 family)/predicted Fe-Mo cluster-binding NifX family protein
MSRNKSKRELSFKPKYKLFAPKEGSSEHIRLLHEEIEAIYLMDHQGMYQEDAAASMGVSRPTFSRIIKNARTKVATALIQGKELHIEDDIKSFRIAFICDNAEAYGTLHMHGSHIIIVDVEALQIKEKRVIPNPLYETKLRPLPILASLFYEEKIDYFLMATIGEGLKSALAAKGIVTMKQESLSVKTLQALVSSL